MSREDDVEIPEVRKVAGSGIPIRGNDIDTDQIIPARFMKVVTFDGLGEFAFFDQRFDDEDNPKEHPLNDERFQDATVMVVNSNFGCGSSREHAPQALMRWGIDAIIGESFAEIFAGNCLALGIPTVTADAEQVEKLQDWIDENPDGKIQIDIEDELVAYGVRNHDERDGYTYEPGFSATEFMQVDVDEGQRKALVEGIWDTTALMKSNRQAIEETAGGLSYLQDAD